MSTHNQVVEQNVDGVELTVDNDYEIGTTYPFIIRRKVDGFIPKECINKSIGYVCIY